MVREVELGENSNLVNEVIGFVNSGLLLRSVNQVVLGMPKLLILQRQKNMLGFRSMGKNLSLGPT